MRFHPSVSQLALTVCIILTASTFSTASQTYVLRSGLSRSAGLGYDRGFEPSSASSHNADLWLIDNRYSISDPDDVESAGEGASDTALASHKHSKAVEIARKYRGSRYVWGGTTSRGFDCSGFVRYVYARLGKDLPRTAREQFHCGQPIHGSRLKAGDVLFFHTSRPGVSHVGIYIGQNKFIHAANPRRGVVVDELKGFYARRLLGARRLR